MSSAEVGGLYGCLISPKLIEIIVTAILISVVILVGQIVLFKISGDTLIAIGFCLDKEGIYNISEYNEPMIAYIDMVNCSNKEQPVMGINTAKVT